MYKIVNGVEVELSKEEVAQRLAEEKAWEEEQRRYAATESYKDKRRAAYPPIGDQLDALYHAMDEGILPKVKGFYDKIKVVKEEFPGPL